MLYEVITHRTRDAAWPALHQTEEVGEQDYPSNIDYDSKTGEITFIYRYYFEKYSSIFVAKCNVENIEKVSWEEIKLSEEVRTVGIYTPCPNNSVLIGSNRITSYNVCYTKLLRCQRDFG